MRGGANSLALPLFPNKQTKRGTKKYHSNISLFMINSSTHGLSHSQDLSLLEENISKAENRVTELYVLSNTYFGNDKQDRMMSITSEICNELLPVVPLSSNSSEDIDASLPPNLRFSRLPAKIRARVCFLRGRALDALPQYSAEAEECLSKAVCNMA